MTAAASLHREKDRGCLYAGHHNDCSRNRPRGVERQSAVYERTRAWAPAGSPAAFVESATASCALPRKHRQQSEHLIERSSNGRSRPAHSLPRKHRQQPKHLIVRPSKGRSRSAHSLPWKHRRQPEHLIERSSKESACASQNSNANRTNLAVLDGTCAELSAA